MKCNKNNIEILTPSGFHVFDGIVMKTVNKVLKIDFLDNSNIVCTPSHVFISGVGELSASSLCEGDYLNSKLIVSIETIDKPTAVYDPVNVRNGNTYISNGVISHNCSFIGSSYTLIGGATLSRIATIPPIFEQDNLKVWEHPEKGHTYVCTVDVSEGVHMDYSAMVVFDITEMPYRVVATFKDNTISSLSYPFLIYQLAIKYNNAYVLIETNNVGGEVANTLLYELEYEHVYYTHKETLNEGMGHPGVRTTKKVKAVGTACLRELVEQDQLIINSHDILAELSVFVKKNASYASSDPNGVNDDLTSCMWLFAWLTKQQLFTDLTNTNIRAILAKKTEENITENLIPFGILSDGHDDLFEDDAPSITLNTNTMESQLERWAFTSPIND